MPHFFVAPGALQGGAVTITDALARHLAGALRVREGDVITVVSDGAHRHRVMIDQATTHRVTGRVVDRLPDDVPPATRITLAQALLKGDQMDAVVQKAVELGAYRIVPLITRRTVVRPRLDRASRQAERWRAIALEAAQQSERTVVPHVDEPQPLASWIASHSGEGGPRLVLGERETSQYLRGELAGRPPARDATLVIGPEGGFDPDELSHAREHGCVVVSLGRAILRAETAAMASLTILQYAWGGLGGPSVDSTESGGPRD